MEVAAFFSHELPAEFTCGVHSHPFLEIVLMEGSAGWMEWGGSKHGYGSGWISVLPARAKHRVHNEEASKHFVLGLIGKELSVLEAGLWKANEPLLAIFADMEMELRQSAPHFRQMIASQAERVVILLRRLGSTGSDTEASAAGKVREAKAFLDSHFDRPGLGLSEVSEKLLISKESLRYLFKKEYGVPPLQYLIQKKIDRAKILLQETDRKVVEVARETGFENEFYFSRIFKQVSGHSPLAWRSKNK